MPAGAVYVGRPTRSGNPFVVADETADGGASSRTEAVRRYRSWLAARPAMVAAARSELAGRDLACWCPLEEPCHADVLLEVANLSGP